MRYRVGGKIIGIDALSESGSTNVCGCRARVIFAQSFRKAVHRVESKYQRVLKNSLGGSRGNPTAEPKKPNQIKQLLVKL